jgi:hypothetical protein
MPVRAPEEYLQVLGAELDQATATEVFRRVWRFDFGRPGFCLLDLGAAKDSNAFRSQMLALKEWLSDVSAHRIGKSLVYVSMARFDQQKTTRFHMDGAADESLLMLGYEPSAVRSRLFLADYSRCAFDLGITPKQFLRDFNPMHGRGESLLTRYVTELPPPRERHWRILLLNNSSLPSTSENTKPLGVLHKAEIQNPTDCERRIVNSIMLIPGTRDEVDRDQQAEFVTTDAISS